MTKQEIEKMFNTCNNYHSCALCPYNPEDISLFIGDKWVGGCPNCDRKLVYAMSKGYRKGYRKAEKVRKETAKEILQEWADDNRSMGIDNTFVKHIAKKYGVEVEE